MWRMLQANAPSDYVLATGVAATVRDFAAAAFASAGLDWQEYVEVDPNYFVHQRLTTCWATRRKLLICSAGRRPLIGAR